MQFHQLADVYGVSRTIPLTYVERAAVDGKFRRSLSRDKHLVVYGGSKQGKTCLRKRNLKDEEYVVVQCGNASTRAQLYEIVLKEAGASISLKETRAISGAQKANVTFTGSAGIPKVASVEGQLGGELDSNSTDSRESHSFDIDPSDPNDVIRVLENVEFRKYIVLEDFHYLSEDVQKEIAIDLKAFHEKSKLSFIVVGVWLESNRLVLYNGDLAGRLIPVDADQWTAEQLADVIRTGEPLMNVVFSDQVRDELVFSCRGNVGLLQEACSQILDEHGVTQTSPALVSISDVALVQKVMQELVKERASRYKNFLVKFVEGFQQTDLEMWRWIAVVIVTTSPDELKRGLKFQAVFKRLNEIHPKRQGRLHSNNVVQAIKNIKLLQHKQRLTPIIFDFDSNESVLQVVDAGFILYVASTERDELLRTVAARQINNNLQMTFEDLLDFDITTLSE